MDIDREFAQRFADEWVDAWNAHDLPRILSHYCDDVEMASPVIRRLAGEPSGRLRGKAALEAYWRRALAATPQLHFEPRSVLVGADSVAIVYRGHRGLAVEVFRFGDDGLVREAWAHYEAAVPPPAAP